MCLLSPSILATLTLMNFNPDRLDIARRRRAMTKRALAERTRVSLRSLVDYYSFVCEPSKTTVDAFSRVLRFPSRFFYGDTLEEPPSGGVSFRALSTIRARDRDQAIAVATLGIGLSDWIDGKFFTPTPDIPNYEYVAPELAAAAVRSDWKLGERSIGNMLHLLERQGVRVLALTLDDNGVDAFSFWHGDIPYIFVNTEKNSERSRMNLAHELGHLILHRKFGAQRNRQAEWEAQQFGAALLMPRNSLLAARELRQVNLNNLIKAKRLWGVSVANLVYRMRSINLISGYRYRRLFADIGRRGFRKNEPEPAERETSQLLEKVFALLRRSGATLSDVAGALDIYPEEIGTLLIGLVNQPLLARRVAGDQPVVTNLSADRARMLKKLNIMESSQHIPDG